jgi:hypothetical protein
VTITTDDLATTNTFRAEVGAPWPFLSDPERVVQQDLDIQEYTDPHHDPMIPYTLVLEPRLVVYKVYNGYWHWGRPSPERLRQDLCAVTQRVGGWAFRPPPPSEPCLRFSPHTAQACLLSQPFAEQSRL